VLQAAFLWSRFGFVTKEKLLKALSYEEFSLKTLMKLTTGQHILIQFCKQVGEIDH